MKKLSLMLLALVLVLALASCGLFEMPANTEAAQAALDAAFSTKEAEVTENFTLETKLTDEFGHEYEIVWTSSNEQVATVEGGAVKVTPNYFNDVTFTLTGTVTEEEVTASIVLSYTVPASASLQETLDAAFAQREFEVTENNFTLPAVLAEEGKYSVAIVWTSSNETVATVDGANVTVTPSYYEDSTFTLTGTVTEGASTATVVLTYAVPQATCTHEYEVVTTVAPTCTAEGWESYRCKHCGRRYMITLFMLPHDYELVETVAATCAADGYEAYVCTVCEGEKVETLEALPHTWEFVETVEATDTSHGYDLYVCTVCEAEAYDKVVHVYNYEAEQYTTPATCTEDGERVMFCYACLLEGAQNYVWETIPATGHSFTVQGETVAPTCIAAGYTVYGCANEGCEETENRDEVAATGEHVDTDDCICDTEGCDAEVIPTGKNLTVAQALYMYANKKYDANTYYNVTGTVQSIASTQYGNMYIADDAGNKIYVYGTYSAQGTIRYDAMPVKPAVGDVITLNSKLATYNNAIQLSNARIVHECEREFACAGCELCGETKGAAAHTGGTATCIDQAVCTVCGSEYGAFADHEYGEDNVCTTEGCGKTNPAASGKLENATITFDSTSKRTEYNTSVQIWEENGITVTNNKSSSTSNVADYSKPARFYKSSQLIVEGAGMTTIVFDCNSNDYATALKNSIGTVAGATVTISSDKVTVTFTEAVNSFTITLSGGQVRMDGITVNP